MWGEGRNDFFSDEYRERDNKYRRQLEREFDKKESEFKTLRAYNDYLETKEDFILNLTNGIKERETWVRINEFRRKHSSSRTRVSGKSQQRKKAISKPKQKLKISVEGSSNVETPHHFAPMFQMAFQPQLLKSKKVAPKLTPELIERRKAAAGWRNDWWNLRCQLESRDLPF